MIFWQRNLRKHLDMKKIYEILMRESDKADMSSDEGEGIRTDES